MRINRLTSLPMLAVAAAGLVVGLATPAAGREASHLINGDTIKAHTIAGNRLKNNTISGTQIKDLKWHALKLTSGWKNATTPGNRPAAYAVDAQGIVHLRGMITGGTYPDPAFELPAKVVPRNLILDLPFVAYAGTEGNLLIQGGEAIPFAAQHGTTTNVTTLTMLEGVTFDS
jgi:hypothetical protein